jgi:hypothetical protein
LILIWGYNFPLDMKYDLLFISYNTIIISLSSFHYFSHLSLIYHLMIIFLIDFNIRYWIISSTFTSISDLIISLIISSIHSFPSIFIYPDIQMILIFNIFHWIYNSSILLRILWIIIYPDYFSDFRSTLILDWLSMNILYLIYYIYSLMTLRINWIIMNSIIKILYSDSRSIYYHFIIFIMGLYTITPILHSIPDSSVYR